MKRLLIYIYLIFVFIPFGYAQDMRDIKPPVYFPFNYKLLIIIISVIFLLGVFLLVIFLFKKKNKTQKIISIFIKSADQKAYEALNELRMKNLPLNGKVKEYYYQLSIIIRRYIEDRFFLKAPDMTTGEFLFSIKNSETLKEDYQIILKEFLILCDIVKFAKYGPTEEEIEKSFDVAVKFVDKTKLQENIEK